MKFPGNCLLVSLIASSLPGNRLRTKRNRMGRLHFYWQDRNGHSWEFYKRGASGLTYLQNSLYIGEIKRTD
jgi:hypothetical protein